MTTSPTAAILALHRSLEAGVAGEALRELFTPDARTLEHPNSLKPLGATSTLEQMTAASTLGAGLLAWQRYDIRDTIESGTTVVVRCTWTGEIAADAGPFHSGQRLTAHIAQFVDVRDGRIASIETYDCYEPFANEALRPDPPE